MNIELTKLLSSLSIALDYVENEVMHVEPYHGRRVAVLTGRMAEYTDMIQREKFVLTQAAALHDCALKEYLLDEVPEEGYIPDELDMSAHCKEGERMLLKLPLYDLVQGAVLYHHDRADGRGAMGKKASETPLSAQLIHCADLVDVTFSLYSMTPAKYLRILQWLEEQRDTTISGVCVDLFLKAVDYELLCSITGAGSLGVLESMIPQVSLDVPVDVLRKMASIFAEITDYKSHFTWRHSLGIAEKAETMGRFYKHQDDVCDSLYIAGALHDIGKLLISNDILEKPGKLTQDEYRVIQNHAMGTWNLLYGIGGLEDITRWAALHHEKLDGSGYPFGLTAEQLGPHERLLACLDIYQALVEERPYKPGLSHREAMEILNRMGDSGQLDKQILKDIDACFAGSGDPAQTRTEEKSALIYAGDAWRCPVCGFVYEGSLPQDFICPRCEQPGSIFEKIN